jgi:hypothetical protein
MLGGGVGLYGVGPNGAGGVDTFGTPGSILFDTPSAGYGYGGAYYSPWASGYCPGSKGANCGGGNNGGPGACRIMWGSLCSFPNHAAPSCIAASQAAR